MIAARGLVVNRGRRAILNHVSLMVERSAFVAVIGANGAGKSTLLAALAGLIAPDQGTVTLDGRPLADIDRRNLARRRAYLPQNPRAEWPISVERLVALGLTPHLPAFGNLPDAMQPKIDAALATCDLTALRDQPATTLSGGELARAMLARALAGEPELLIADEPFAGLDPRHVLDGAGRLTELARSGVTVVAALHDLTLAARHATHVAALKGGRLIAYGPTADIIAPALLGETFDAECRLIGSGLGAIVDFSS